MRVAHIVPPPWTGLFPLGGYRMALAHWVADYPSYVTQMRKLSATVRGAEAAFLLLDNGAFENEQVQSLVLQQAAEALMASEVVLPDVPGNARMTLNASWKALKSLTISRVMFVPQGRSLDEWSNCLANWAAQWETSKHSSHRSLAIGVTSLRTEEGLSQLGTKKQLAQIAAGYGYPIHLLGIPDVREFTEHELPLAHKLKIRGVDSSIAFALAAAGKLLLPSSEKIPLGPPESHETLSTQGRRLAFLNTYVLTDWVETCKVLPGIPVRLIRFAASRWLKFYGEGFATVKDIMEACKFPKGNYALREPVDDDVFEAFVFPLKKGSPGIRKGDKHIKIGD